MPVRKRLPFLIVLLLVIGFSLAGLTRLRFETDILEVLPKNLPSVQALRVSQKYFDNDQQVALLLRNENEEIYEEDVAEFVEILREKLSPATVLYQSEFEESPEAFGDALAEIWRYAPSEEVAAMEQRLLDKPSLAVHLEEVKAEVRNSFDQEKSTMAAYDPLGFLQHPAMRQFMDSELSFQSDDGKSQLILINHPEHTTDYQQHGLWLEKIRAAANEWPGLEEPGMSYGLTGGPVFNAEIGAGMESDMSGTVTITCILVALLFLLIQRHLGQLLAISVLMGLSFLITLGVGGWVFGTLNLVSVGFAAILLGLVIDYAVVILRESLERSSSPRELRRELAPGILWAAFTTAAVFGLLTLSTFNGVRQLGGLIVIGLATGATVMLVFTPMFLGKFPSKAPKVFLKAPFAGKIVARLVIGMALAFAVIVFAVKGEPDVSFDFSMVQPSTSEAAATFEKIKENFPAWSDKNLQLIAHGESWDELRAAADQAARVLEKLKSQGVIAHFQWPVDLIPNETAFAENEKILQNIATKRAEILAQVEASGFSETGTALDRMVMESLESPGDAAGIGELAKHTIAVSPDGRKFLSGNVMVTEEVTEKNAAKLAALHSDGFNLTSWAVIQADLLPSVRRDFQVIFLPATFVLLAALIAVFRSFRDALLSITVLVTVLALVNAFVVVTGQSWNFLSGMAIPLIVGTGIDYSIHLIFSLRRNDGDLGKVWNGVGKAICFCGLSTAIGFGSLLFASNEMLRSMGMLCSLGVFLTAFLSVFVVPGLWKRGRS